MDIKTDERDRVLLEETFYVLTKKNCVFRVRLTRAGLCLAKESEHHVKEQIVPIDDIIGCRCLRSKRPSNRCTCQSLSRTGHLKVVEENSNELDASDASAYLYIYAYLLQDGGKSGRRRERTIITLRFRSFDRYEDNNKEAQRWRTTIKRLIRGETVPAQRIGEPAGRFREDRRLLILCNPKSGPGKGRLVFQQKIAPILQEAEIPYDLHITKHANYAREFLRNCNPFQWSGVVGVGGDGIIFEVINGIFERCDWSEVVRHLPIGIVPSGSGNGLARSIAYHSSEPYIHQPTLSSALAAVRDRHAMMDLVRVETTSEIIFSFLSIGWGLLSDIDIESERLRILGGQRFTIWSLARLIGLRSYGGKLWYQPVNPAPPINTVSRPSEGSTIDLPEDIQLETAVTGRQRVDSWYSAASRRSAYFSTNGSSYQSTMGSFGGGEEGGTRTYGPASRLPCLTAPLPSDWCCIEGRFVMVHASYQTHLGEDCLFAPDAKLNDGIIWLLVVRAGASRGQLLQFLLGLRTGAHASPKSDGRGGNLIELLAVNAFRIEPDSDEEGYMTVDGENVRYGTIQAEIFPELIRVMVP